MFKKIPYSTHDEWLNLRKQGIGGSDAGLIMGKKQYNNKNIVDLWLEKSGKINKPNETNSAMERGHKLEPFIRQLYAIDNPDMEIREVKELYVHPKYDFIRASLDGEIILPNGNIGILEIKTTTIHQYSYYKELWKNEENNDTIPENYLYQVLHYFLVTDYEFAVLVADIRFKCFEDNSDTFDLNKQLKTYTIYKNEWMNRIEELKQKEIEFWSYVTNDIEPPYIKEYHIGIGGKYGRK